MTRARETSGAVRTDETIASRISDKLYRMMRYRRGLIPPGKRLLPVGAPELELAQALDSRIAEQCRLEGFSEEQAWAILDSRTFCVLPGASVTGRHVFPEAYLTTYADGTYVMCRWQVAP